MNNEIHKPSERDEIRELLAADIRALDRRINEARDEGIPPDDEEIHLKRLRTLAQLARQYRLLARDADVDEMEDEVNALSEILRQRADE